MSSPAPKKSKTLFFQKKMLGTSTDPQSYRSQTDAGSSVDSKFIMDTIYGMISLDKRLFQIIDTPHFQRLRYIKQLGTSYFCFPTATHTRFSHSLGTAYLASRIFDLINSPELDLRPADKLSVTTAALVHDIGHGPFSHSFEQCVRSGLGLEDWSHEKMGLKIIEHLFETENLDLIDFNRVKQILTGTLPQEYRFLSQIIANHDFGFDVDRLDYLQRDCYSVGLTPGFDWTVLLSHLKVNTLNSLAPRKQGLGQTRTLSFHEKRRPELLNFYRSRYNLFHQVYHHPATKSIEYMISDAILASEDLLKIRMALEDVEAYLKLDDSIYNWLHHHGNHKSKVLIDRIERRKFYPLIYRGASIPPVLNNHIVDRVVDHYGQGSQNPLETVPFYSTKTNAAGGIACLGSVDNDSANYFSTILPSKFESVEYRVYDSLGL